jgi:hypothetical protein
MDIVNAEPKFQGERSAQVDQAPFKLPVELLRVSIEEVMHRATTTTQVLTGILVRDYSPRYSCHWGINE